MSQIPKIPDVKYLKFEQRNGLSLLRWKSDRIGNSRTNKNGETINAALLMLSIRLKEMIWDFTTGKKGKPRRRN